MSSNKVSPSLFELCEAACTKMSDEQYFADYRGYMSASQLKKFAEDPIEWVENLDKRDDTPKEHLEFGKALHGYVLEGIAPMVLETHNPRTGKSYGWGTKKHIECCEDNGVSDWKSVLTKTQGDMLMAMNKAIYANEEASGYLGCCTNFEFALRGMLHDIRFQGKVDAMNTEGLIVDLKTYRKDADPWKQCFEYKYGWQADIYRKLYEQVYGFKPEFVFIMVEKSENPDVEVINAESLSPNASASDVEVACAAFRYGVAEKDFRASLFTLGGLL